jgi:hypothetical protein
MTTVFGRVTKKGEGRSKRALAKASSCQSK